MRARPKFAIVIPVIALAFAGLVGCSADTESLEGTQWGLTASTLSSIDPADTMITLSFTADRISGEGGVNIYNGSYTLGQGNSFSVGPLASTMMAGPESAMRAESAYMALLQETGSYKLDNDKLVLFDAEGNESLTFERIAD